MLILAINVNFENGLSFLNKNGFQELNKIVESKTKRHKIMNFKININSLF